MSLLASVSRLLAVPEGQGGRALRMLGLVFMLSVALSLMKSAQSGIFLEAYPRSMIPWAFAASSVLLALLSAATVAAATRVGVSTIASIAVALTALSMLAMRALLTTGAEAIPFLLYVVIEAASGVLVIQVWGVASAATDARSARRLLPIAGLGSGAAWTLSGLAVHPLAHSIGAESLLIIAPLALGASFVLVRSIERWDLGAHGRVGTGKGKRAPLREAFRFVFKVPLLRFLAALALLTLVTEEVMDFHLMATAREELDTAEHISAFFGRYYAVTSALGMLLLAGPAARVLSALGASRSLLVTPAAIVVAALGATLVPGLTVAVILRGVGRVLKQTVWSNALEQMQTPLAHARRAQARAATRGVLAPGGYALTALGLALVPDHVDSRYLAAIVLVLAAITSVFIATRARRTYVRALERAVDERRLFLGPGRAPMVAELDPDAIATLAAELSRAETERAALAAEVLGLCRASDAVAPLTLGLAHAEPEVRQSAAIGLAKIPCERAARALASKLGDADVGARRAIARALRQVLDADPPCRKLVEVRDAVREAAADGDAEVAATCRAASLHIEFEGGLALGGALLPMLRSEHPAERLAALAELTGEAARAKGIQAALRKVLEQGAPTERIEAARVVVALGLMTLLPDVVALLGDGATGPSVARLLVEVGEHAFAGGGGEGQTTMASLTEIARRIASSPRADASVQESGLVRRLLSHRVPEIRRHATFALAEAVRSGQRPALPRAEVRKLVDKRVRELFSLTSVLAGLAQDDGVPDWELEPAFHFLGGEVELRIEQARAEVLSLLLLEGDAGRLASAVAAASRAPSRERDAQVAELLEAALDPSLSRLIVPLFERLSLRERIDAARRLSLLDDSALKDPLDSLVSLGDLHLRRCAQLTYGERFAERYPELCREDADVIPRIERMRFLRSVPLFAALPAEDLVSVADAVTELDHAEGERVFHEGDPGEELFVVIRGQVRIEQGGVALATLGEREFFGDFAVLDHQPRSADAICASDARLLRLRGADLRELMATRPQLTEAIVRVLVQRLRDTGKRIQSTGP